MARMAVIPISRMDNMSKDIGFACTSSSTVLALNRWLESMEENQLGTEVVQKRKVPPVIRLEI
jgi:hypothetical protein